MSIINAKAQAVAQNVGDVGSILVIASIIIGIIQIVQACHKPAKAVLVLQSPSFIERAVAKRVIKHHLSLHPECKLDAQSLLEALIAEGAKVQENEIGTMFGEVMAA